MKKIYILVLIILIVSVLFILPSIAEATDVTVTRNIYSNNGSMKFTFEGLTLDMTHEYQFGFTKTAAAAVEDWYLITEYTETAATVNIMTTTAKMRAVVNAVDTGYVTIKDKTTDTVILQPHAVDLKLPYLYVTNYTVISNGKDLDSAYIHVALRNAYNSEPYYQYEKITDENIIAEYKKIKAANGDVTSMQSMLKTTPPNSNWSVWGYWNNHDSFTGMNGYGYTTKTVSVPDNGLYYLWVYFSGNNIKNLYGYILVDNLAPDIALESISLPATKAVKLGKTLTLSPTFNPSNATNKIVTWSSSDETVATVSNAGVVIPITVGSTIITVTSEDGNKTSTCTVTVTEEPKTPVEENEEVSNKNLGNHTYSIIQKTMPWKEAKAYCEEKGGYLVTITSEEEQAFITSYIKEHQLTNNRFWIGATDEDSEGNWKWITGEQFSYTNWSDYQPDNREDGGQNYCVYLAYERSYKEKAEKWDDINVGAEDDIYFICEWGEISKEAEKQEEKPSNDITNDNTTSTEKIPNTGKSVVIVSIFAIALIITIVTFIKYLKFKEI